MREVRGIEFSDTIADVVQELVDRMEEEIGQSYLFSKKKPPTLTFALRPPDESNGKRKKAYRHFLLVSPHGEGAVAKRPLPPKTGWEKKELTAVTLDEVFRSGMSWFHQVRKMNIPDEYQDTENWLVLAGGRFESKRSKF